MAYYRGTEEMLGTGRPATGTVKWYSPEKGYGFIAVEGGADVFVHRSAIIDGRGWLIDGQEVSLLVQPGPKGMEAAEVRVTREAAEVPARRAAAWQRAQAGDDGGSRRAPREPYRGPVPAGPVPAIVRHIAPDGRFLFVRLEREGLDVFVHGGLVDRLEWPPREGDRVEVVVEQSERGPRARSLTPA